jgi:Domain of unknown function (DUF4189)
MTLQVISRMALSAKARIGLGAVFAALLLLASGTLAGTASQAQGAVPTEARYTPANTGAAKPSALRCRVPRCYGAMQMAYQDGTVGRAWNYSSKRRAFRAAGNVCRSHTRYPCHRIVWVRNGCAAVAVRWRNGSVVRYGWGVARNKRPAVRAALRKCQQDGRQCRKRSSVCTSR